jgi:magnesium-transporting ATPase (P-type)
MTVRRLATAEGVLDVTGTGYEPKGEFLKRGAPSALSRPFVRLLQAGALASDAKVALKHQRWVVEGDPTEAALVS